MHKFHRKQKKFGQQFLLAVQSLDIKNKTLQDCRIMTEQISNVNHMVN